MSAAKDTAQRPNRSLHLTRLRSLISTARLLAVVADWYRGRAGELYVRPREELRMATVSVPRKQIANGSLPSVCVVCGADAPHRRFPGVGAPSLAWVLFSPLISLMTFWAYILFASRSSGEGGLPFCDRHHGYWTRRAWFIVVGFAAVVGLMIVAGALEPPPPAPGREAKPYWLGGVAGCWLLVYLPTFLVLHLSATRPTGSNRRSLVLSGASSEFAASISG
jgi:hypothetical protein